MAGGRERYDAKRKAHPLALLQGKTGVAELDKDHDVQLSVFGRWRREALLHLQRLAQGKPSPIENMRKELRHIKRELKNSQREQDFFVQA